VGPSYQSAQSVTPAAKDEPTCDVDGADGGNAFLASQLGGADVQTEARGGGTYTVARGDTLWSIAADTYGDGALWGRIRDANPGRVHDGGALILVDTVLDLPSIEVPVACAAPPAQEADGGVCLDPAIEATVAIRQLLNSGDALGALALLGTLDEATFKAVVGGLDTKEAEALLAIAGIAEAMGMIGFDLGVAAGTTGAMANERSQEIVIPTTLLKPAANTIDDDFKRANEIYNPHGIEIEKGPQVVLDEEQTKRVLGGDTELDEFSGDNATAEELELIKGNRQPGRLSGYWVPTMPDSRGEALTTSLKNILEDQTSVVVNTTDRAQDTFAHEVGHTLGLDHSADANNLMGSGGVRDISGAAGTDQLTDEQLDAIRDSAFVEAGKKGVGQ
jgi:hypothetical protein